MIADRCATILGKTTNIKAKLELERIFASLSIVDTKIDKLHKDDGIEIFEWHKSIEDNITRYQLDYESKYTEEERKQFAGEEELVSEIDKPGPYGYTLLHYCAEEGDLDKFKLLIAQGAKLSVKCNQGHTPRDKAARHGHKHIIEYIDNLSR